MPDAANFYCTWMEGYIQLAKDNILGAMKKYKDAFIVAFLGEKRISIDEARRLAGKN